MTAILIDGGFYRKRAKSLFGVVSGEARAKEVCEYCRLHLKDQDGKGNMRSLYRLFYYDCPPVDRTVYHPVLRKNVNLGKTDTYLWTNNFFNALAKQRKLALRLGRLSEITTGYKVRPDIMKRVFSGSLSFDQLTESDVALEVGQKGVDMKIGIDIVHLAYKRLVDQIILISGDSDFVPAAKLARREGVDFILDPMGAKVSDDLMLHVDGVQSHHHDYIKRVCRKVNKSEGAIRSTPMTYTSSNEAE